MHVKAVAVTHRQHHYLFHSIVLCFSLFFSNFLLDFQETLSEIFVILQQTGNVLLVFLLSQLQFFNLRLRKENKENTRCENTRAEYLLSTMLIRSRLLKFENISKVCVWMWRMCELIP